MHDNGPRPGRSDYPDFDLEIGTGTGREYPVAVLDSPAGEARGSMHFPFDGLELENRLLTLQNALLRSGGAPRRTLSPEEQAVQDFGRELFEALFAPEMRSCFDVSLREADRQRKGLRLKLRIQSPKMAVLPWEYLYHPGQGEYVSLSTRTPIVRYLEMPQRIQPLAVAPPLRILGMIASPSDLPSLSVERAIRDLRARGLVDLTWLPGQTWRDLLRAMRQGEWHILHFIGHGGFDRSTGEGLIVLADREGRAARFHAKQLGRLLANHVCLRLVLLNSCEGAKGSEGDIFSRTAAILVRRGIPAVLAMQSEMTDGAAIEFARQFYEALADAMPVDGAMAEARMTLSFAVTNTVEWGTPVVYMCTPDGVLFHMTDAPDTREPADRVPTLRAEADPPLEKRLERLYVDLARADWIDFVDTYAAPFRRDVFFEQGGFDPEFQIDEDQEFSFRLARAGYAMVFVPVAVVYHLHPSGLWAYTRCKAQLGRWKVRVHLRHPAKATSDSYTPWTQKAQIALQPLIGGPILAAIGGLMPWAAILFTAFLGLATTVPLVLKAAWHGWPVALVTPALAFVRAGTLALGIGWGMADLSRVLKIGPR